MGNYSIYLKPEIREKLLNTAVDGKISMSGIVSRALQQYFDKEKPAKVTRKRGKTT